MLEIQNVSKTFNAGTVNQKTALNGLNLKLNEGDFVTVIGGNGAGKSTMLNAVAGVWPWTGGPTICGGSQVTLSLPIRNSASTRASRSIQAERRTGPVNKYPAYRYNKKAKQKGQDKRWSNRI